LLIAHHDDDGTFIAERTYLRSGNTVISTPPTDNNDEPPDRVIGVFRDLCDDASIDRVLVVLEVNDDKGRGKFTLFQKG